MLEQGDQRFDAQAKGPLAGYGSVNRRSATAVHLTSTDMLGRHLWSVDNVMTKMLKMMVMKNENLHWVDKVFIILQLGTMAKRSHLYFDS